MKFISYCALLSTAVGTTTQEDLDTMPEAHVTNTPQTWKADTYTNNARQDMSEDKPTECPVKCNYDGTPGRHMTVIWDGNSLGQANRDGGSGWKCGLEVSTGSQCECACEGDEMSVTVTRSCFEEWSRLDQQHILNDQDGHGYHFLPNGQGFAGDNPLCSHDDAAGDGLQVKHTINADLSGSTGPGGSTSRNCDNELENTRIYCDSAADPQGSMDGSWANWPRLYTGADCAAHCQNTDGCVAWMKHSTNRCVICSKEDEGSRETGANRFVSGTCT